MEADRLRLLLSRVRRWGMVAMGVLLLVLVIAWMSGAFHPRIEPGRTVAAAVDPDEEVFVVTAQPAAVYARVAGTIRATHEATIASRLLARVKAVHVAAGQRVEAGQVLIELDQADVQARIQQVAAAVDAAAARLRQAESDLEKLIELRRHGAATARELDDAHRVRAVTAADLDAAGQTLAEVRTMIDDATVRSPIDGVIIEKFIEEGDLAQPGRPLVNLYDPLRLQLEAAVPERIAVGLSVGDVVEVEIEAIGFRGEARISEIVPQAAAVSRSMLVKVTGACPPGVYSGMFGRLLIPRDHTQRLLVPHEAVRRVGQLTMLDVLDDAGRIERRLVRLGETDQQQVEVLAGIAEGERVLVARN
jgi:RND family efflux transporter MFP subunit